MQVEDRKEVQDPTKLCPETRLTGHAGNPPGQGPFITVTLTLKGQVITEATYETYQCPGCQACGRAIVALAKGKTLPDARALKHEDVVRAVGPLLKHRQICYGLAILALAEALKNLVSPENL